MGCVKMQILMQPFFGALELIKAQIHKHNKTDIFALFINEF